MWIVDTQQTVMESGYHAESVYVSHNETPSDNIHTATDTGPSKKYSHIDQNSEAIKAVGLSTLPPTCFRHSFSAVVSFLVVVAS